ncbi:hypothetical protein [Bradyrhizobium sp. AUGA SZCCT0283]|uniref:hypothetical protein n=1 Tax=Bradyrhizobium sp. AUGA SZCCT0283 TaxID=2807671 RepID=UPI001BAAF22A|nr:hypothetical protein [Bradyrhizobium sp. AUGA SZCCT0283]MBR1277468.1 hypothetical protein [Bradyrhizobium sp. AUGA SZCCT0283]
MTKHTANSKKSIRGGRRPGAGRPPKTDANEIPVADALERLDLALKARDRDNFYSTQQRRWHVAMVLWGIPPEIIAAAFFRPGVSESFRASIENAIKTVEICQGAARS